MRFEENSITPSSKNIPINFSPSYANNFRKSLTPSPKNVKPYVNINGNANNQGYNVQVGTGIGNNRGYVGVFGNASGGWNSRPSTSIGIGGGIRF